MASPKYTELIKSIGSILEEGRRQAVRVVNTILTETYWQIGRQIVEYEQETGESAGYGSKLFDRIANDLRRRYGKGFSRSNIIYMRLLYSKHQKSQTLSDRLTWSHYVEFLKIDDDLERGFYEKQCLLESWSVRELSRQINSALFYRIALSKHKSKVLELAKQGNIIEEPQDIIKDPYILEFLNLPEDHSEKELEQKIIDNLQRFILELGKGFSFVARQFRISLANRHYYVDLVFYHHILRCFVLIDLKIGEVTPADIGQMNLYLNYFRAEENKSSDNAPIGMILSAEKDSISVKYALGGISNRLFVSKYRLYLPDKRVLERKLRRLLR